VNRRHVLSRFGTAIGLIATAPVLPLLTRTAEKAPAVQMIPKAPVGEYAAFLRTIHSNVIAARPLTPKLLDSVDDVQRLLARDLIRTSAPYRELLEREVVHALRGR
jgi:hypothetical protein